MLKKVGGFSMPATVQTPDLKSDQRDPKIMRAAQMYETQFLREMVRAMRKTVNESAIIKTNMAEKIFREQLDDEYVDQWVNVKGGVGLSNLIYDQIVDRYGQQLGIQKPNGPLNQKNEIKLKSLKPTDTKGMSIKLKGDQASVHSPWSGKVAQSFRTPDGLQTVKINHPNGLNSLLRFMGETDEHLNGKQVNAGDIVGSTAGLLEWAINPSGLVEG
ncbi:MAG: hypothetical protein A4S09_00835 [Proteobacteria bacterium SG_bin7]|nr:MAG: hypothetical protein A4S09_00835 [Proteobacteria bacterium SG_bin7]